MNGKPVVTVAPDGHLDDDALVVRALAPGDEGGDAADEAISDAVQDPADTAAAHLAACPSCRARSAALRRVVVAARLDAPGEEADPPDRVWSAIRAELRLGQDPVVPLQRVQDEPAAVTPLEPRRRSARRVAPWMLAAAAAGGLLLGWVAGQASAGPTPPPSVATPPAAPQEDQREDSVTVLARARLQALPVGENPTGAVPASGGGLAELDERGGGRELVVRADGLGASSGATAAAGASGYYEVWLIDVPDGRLVSLGVLDAAEGSFTVPAEIDAGAFSTVDVSFEPLDGEPTHSGASVLRGTLVPEA